ncbi:hypothetical protein LTR85_009096 [Meristemomyces frigidus]|nr:hypothetical protein LTR85_009096 [Meristemomyces frigidus]
MAKIAWLSMLYLPASFVATFFSMPFFALDDAHHFSGLRKIWYYVIFAAAAMILTFAGSWAWDKVSPGLSEVQEDKPDRLNAGSQSVGSAAQVDARVLEPEPYVPPSYKELVEQVAAFIGRRPERGTDDDGRIEHGNGSDAVDGTQPENDDPDNAVSESDAE